MSHIPNNKHICILISAIPDAAFPSYAGHAVSEDPVRATGTARATTITGGVRVQDITKRIPFTISRT
ncbi:MULTISPECIES: hypothetical protein [Kitasatospora]|uniref:Uncharacterized protein n=1 Tax=Kitasatospora cystarginea TaxID=58350 RepID=A0ABP5RRP1_9ACTN